MEARFEPLSALGRPRSQHPIQLDCRQCVHSGKTSRWASGKGAHTPALPASNVSLWQVTVPCPAHLPPHISRSLRGWLESSTLSICRDLPLNACPLKAPLESQWEVSGWDAEPRPWVPPSSTALWSPWVPKSSLNTPRLNTTCLPPSPPVPDYWQHPRQNSSSPFVGL